MTEARGAALLAAGPSLRESLDHAITSAGFTTMVVDPDQVESALRDAELQPALDNLIGGEVEALVIGDGIFPSLTNPDDAIREGMRRSFAAVKAVLRCMMKHRFGRVIIVAPPLTSAVFPQHALRGGLAGLTKSISREVGSRGVTANLNLPGYISDDPTSPSPYVATGRVAPASELAGAVSFILSEASAYMTGQILTLDGGLDTGYH